jgi:hypothetical protein
MLLEGYTGSSATGTTPYTAVFSTQQSGALTGFGACDGLTANITNIIAFESDSGTIQATGSAAHPSQISRPEFYHDRPNCSKPVFLSGGY